MSAERAGLGSRPARRIIRDDDRYDGTTTRVLSLVPRVPYEPEAELSVLAELVEPLHDGCLLAGLTADDFYDPRHRRIAAAVLAGREPEPGDAAYVQHLARFAFPLTVQGWSAFTDAARKRARLLELERERCELLGVVA